MSEDDFPPPPREFTDGEGRDITLRAADEADHEALVEMYKRFNPEDRAQGIPPATEPLIRDWLESVTESEGPAVVAIHEDIVGHVLLVSTADEGKYELAIFVLREYQSAGIGTELLRTLFGLAQEEDIDRVWLTVERWNDPAVNLYKSMGFETIESRGLELEMERHL